MKVIMVMYDSLNRHFLPNYGCDSTIAPNFTRLGEKCVTFDHCYCGSMPCMPARRELHTGRYNFLHRSWGPMEPYDDSMPEILAENGIYTHLVSDHGHYWEDGGATYHTRYNTWECVRGHEGDPWKPMMNPPKAPEHLGTLWPQDWVNRQFMKREEDQPQPRTFAGGLEFLDLNHDQDNWFLQLETFDPHEPFFTQKEFQDLYDPDYDGPLFDWPQYQPVSEEEKPYVGHVRKMYQALVTMCDKYLGKVLDKMDEYNLWEDTMLIVNTDHGFFLGEDDQWSKTSTLLMREVVAHTPLFIYDPRSRKVGRSDALVQTIDLAPTILDAFSMQIPKDMEGLSLLPVIREGAKAHDEILIGSWGTHITVTDGKYKYILCPNADNWPLYQYTLMPTHMRGMFAPGELTETELSEPFPFTKNIPLMKIPDKFFFPMPTGRRFEMKQIVEKVGKDAFPFDLEVSPHKKTPPTWKTELFNLEEDPWEQHPIQDPETEKRLRMAMTKLMIRNHAPIEQYTRMGLEKEYEALR